MPRIESVDFFYLSMPEVEDIGDGSQDALVVRVSDGKTVGWGECEASPLVSIAALRLPDVARRLPSGRRSVLGQRLDDRRRHHAHRRAGRARSMDVLQAPHTFSGIEMALWDLHGQAARRAGLVAARLRQGQSQDALCLAALRRHAARDAGAGARGPRARLPCGEIRLGSVRRGRGRAKTPTICMRRARGLDRKAGYWSMPARCGSRMWSARPARLPALEEVRANGSRSRSLAAPASLWRARAALRQGEARRRRGCAQRLHGDAHDRSRRHRLRADRCGRIGGIAPGQGRRRLRAPRRA